MSPSTVSTPLLGPPWPFIFLGQRRFGGRATARECVQGFSLRGPTQANQDRRNEAGLRQEAWRSSNKQPLVTSPLCDSHTCPCGISRPIRTAWVSVGPSSTSSLTARICVVGDIQVQSTLSITLLWANRYPTQKVRHSHDFAVRLSICDVRRGRRLGSAFSGGVLGTQHRARAHIHKGGH